MKQSPHSNAIGIKKQALHLGFDDVGITTAAPLERDIEALRKWLVDGKHAGMDYMTRNLEKRGDPQAILEGCRSVICVAKNHYREMPEDSPEGEGKVARYAQGRDYHRVMEKPMRRLTKFVRTLGDGVDTKWHVDTGHVLERGLAARAGLGFQGKNTMLISRHLGSHIFLGVVFTTLDLTPDDEEPPRCGRCTKCIDACPTDAFPEPWVLDSRRCLSYLTIENRTDLPADVDLHGWLFGCDICQDVCPWNRFASSTSDPKIAEQVTAHSLDLKEIAALDQTEFEIQFYGTPLWRAHREGLVRSAQRLLDPPAC